MKKITIELVISAFIVSFIEVGLLYFTGLLKSSNPSFILLVTAILSVIELVLVFIIEDFILLAKHGIRKRINKRR